MTQLRLVRDVFKENCTLGQLSTPAGLFFSLEDRFREVSGRDVAKWKVPAKTAIPMGNYRVIIDFSNRFQKHLPKLLDVPGFSGIRVHSLNNSSQTEGCIGLGENRDIERGIITNSRAAMGRFMIGLEEWLKHGDVWLQVI